MFRRNRHEVGAAIERRRWAPVLARIGQFSDPIVTTPAFISDGTMSAVGGHAFLATGHFAATITEAPRSEERPLVTVSTLADLNKVGLLSHRLVIVEGEEALMLDLFPSEFSRRLVLGLREQWERITGGKATGDWSAWECGVVRTPAWRRAGA